MGIVITVLSPNAPFFAKIAFSMAGLVCVLMFVYSLKFQKTGRGF